jgi:transcription antitermination factor NusG
MQLWYALQTLPKHAFQVHARLIERNVESFLSRYTGHNSWKKCRSVDITRPLFPCYIFVYTGLSNSRTVVGAPGVVALIGSRHEPWPVDASLINTPCSGLYIRSRRPHLLASTGGRGRIVASPLTRLQGVLMRIKCQRRLVINVDMIPSCFTAEIYENEIEITR